MATSAGLKTISVTAGAASAVVGTGAAALAVLAGPMCPPGTGVLPEPGCVVARCFFCFPDAAVAGAKGRKEATDAAIIAVERSMFFISWYD